VLSVQSHVVFGIVGNRAAVFPLQTLGLDVDFINSVQFSNHTGYPVLKGTVMDGNDLETLFEGLCMNDLEDYDYVLTGYIGSVTFLQSVSRVLQRVQEKVPSFRYVCDPVLGDDGQYYVPKELVATYLAELIPRAFMITPNQFEAELLVGAKISSHDDVLRALKQLHAAGPKVVVLTSCELDAFPGELCSYVLDSTTSPVKVTRYRFAKLDGTYTGTGDVLAALLLGWVHIIGDGKSDVALRHAIATMQVSYRHVLNGPMNAMLLFSIIETLPPHRKSMYKSNSFMFLQEILKITKEKQIALSQAALRNTDGGGTTGSAGEETSLSKAQVVRYRELCLVQGKRYIENPPIEHLNPEYFEMAI
jgi:pyridoxine kinase